MLQGFMQPFSESLIKANDRVLDHDKYQFIIFLYITFILAALQLTRLGQQVPSGVWAKTFQFDHKSLIH